MRRPFTIEQDSGNSLRIVDADGEELCQFYTDEDKVTLGLLMKAQFVLEAVNAR